MKPNFGTYMGSEKNQIIEINAFNILIYNALDDKIGCQVHLTLIVICDILNYHCTR